MKQSWVMAPSVPDDVVGALGFPAPQSQLLYNRGLTSRKAALAFLSPSGSELHDPMLLPDMDPAVSRLRRAIDEGELIGVFGDFDIDGISGTAVVTTGLRNLGGRALPYIPDREEEGHGLNETAVRSLADRGVSVLVTVDCGASDDSETALAAELGVDSIITDHHTMFESAPYGVVAMINAKRPDSEYPFAHLTGVGMAYKLVQALYADAGRGEPSELLELVALGTVGDVGPLIGENRYFVSEGLKRLNGTWFAGLRALTDVSGLGDRELDTGALSFQIIPRLNAPGRMGDAGISLELLMTRDTVRAESLAALLDSYNSQRKGLTDKGVRQAEAQIRRRWGTHLPGIIMVGRREWTSGILGLIAARLAEAYGRPAIALSVGDETSRASARSVAGFDVLGAIEQRNDLLVRFGGHDQAAGFTVSNQHLATLADHFESISATGSPAGPQLQVDLVAGPSLVQRELFDFGLGLAPYGEGSPEPIYVSTGLRVLESRAVGGGGRHLKMRLDDGVAAWDAIAFRKGDRIGEARAGGRVDIAYRMETNTWNGRTSLQLVVEDFS